MADFPTNLASDGSLFIARDNVASTLNGGVSAAATSMTLASSSLFPSKGTVSIENEIIFFGANDTATAVLSSLTRGFLSTTAAIHANGITANMYHTSGHHNATKDEVIEIERYLLQKFGSSTTQIIIPASITSVQISSASITQPNQPSFLVYISASQLNVTGDGTTFTCTFDTELFDQGANFSANVFTAPVTGRYQLNVKLELDQVSQASHTDVDVLLVTSNRSYEWRIVDVPTSVVTINPAFSVLADMDANDTAFVTVNVGGASKVVDLIGTAAQFSHFSGSLIN